MAYESEEAWRKAYPSPYGIFSWQQQKKMAKSGNINNNNLSISTLLSSNNAQRRRSRNESRIPAQQQRSVVSAISAIAVSNIGVKTSESGNGEQ
jgi:hypothetical protein